MSKNPAIHDRPPPRHPAGDKKDTWLKVLEQGANMLQDAAPMKHFDVYVVGFHCAKCDASMQMEAHHYCKVVNEDLLQCVIFDGNTADANLIGIEYIISERLFNELPEEERRYWHPHNYEVLSGELVAPGLPDAAEKALMKRLVNSYGKTWHTWHTGRHDGKDTGHALPLGEPMLMWSFNRDGECDAALKENRNRIMRIDTLKKMEQRHSLVDLTHPQHGVNAMASEFSGTRRLVGVKDVHDR